MPKRKQEREEEKATKSQKVQLAIGRLMLPVCSVFGQSPDDIVTCLRGPSYAIPSAILKSLPEEEVENNFLDGYMTQGKVRAWPELKLKEKDPDYFRERRNDASFVRATWILSHLICEQEPEVKYGADFKQAVKLAKRMSETMLLISKELEERAKELGEALMIQPTTLEKLDQEAKAKVVMEAPIHLQPFVPKFSHHFKDALTRMELPSDEAMYAFGQTMGHVFSFQLVSSTRFQLKTTEVAIIPNGSKKPYEEMSEAEKEISGSISMNEIMDDLLETDETKQMQKAERAIINSLKASRGLAMIAKTLEDACAFMTCT